MKVEGQLELIFSPIICWSQLTQQSHKKVLDQLSLLLLSNITESKQGETKEDQSCQEK